LLVDGILWSRAFLLLSRKGDRSLLGDRALLTDYSRSNNKALLSWSLLRHGRRSLLQERRLSCLLVHRWPNPLSRSRLARLKPRPLLHKARRNTPRYANSSLHKRPTLLPLDRPPMSWRDLPRPRSKLAIRHLPERRSSRLTGEYTRCRRTRKPILLQLRRRSRMENIRQESSRPRNPPATLIVRRGGSRRRNRSRSRSSNRARLLTERARPNRRMW